MLEGCVFVLIHVTICNPFIYDIVIVIMMYLEIIIFVPM